MRQPRRTRTRHEVLLLAVSAAAALTAAAAVREAAPASPRLWLATAASLALALAALFAFWFGGAARRRLIEALDDERNGGAQSLLSAIPDGLLLVRDDRIVSVNRALCDQLGFSREELLEARAPFPFWPPEHGHDLETFHRSLATRGDHAAELTLRHRDGDRIRVILAGRLVPDEGGGSRQLLSVHDVSEIHRRERRLAELAVREPETGLLDERAFEERLGEAVRDALRRGDPVAVVLLDVLAADGGNALGRPEGLLAIDRLRRLGRAEDLLARTGRHELGWILPGTDAGGALEAVERWRSELEAVGGLALTAGICDLESAGDALTLYALADRALAAARQVGPGATERHPPVPA